MQRPVDFKLPHFFNYPPYFTLQPVRETREKQVQLWKELILDYCRSQKMYIISLEEDFPLFSNPKIERSLSYEAKEAFLAALVSEGRAEWVDKSHKKCLILWLRIQDWANYIVDFVKENGLEVTTIEDIRSGIETHGTEMSSYVVYKDEVSGVYDDWEECQRQVHHFSGNNYKGYTTRAEAKARYARYLAGERRERRRNHMKISFIAMMLYVMVV
ncbi:vacuolar protein sorting-associated protein 25-like [Hordeum vulgare subsp. vulgare]|uniref:Ribonuclease H1 N-terminal domain-containing protein n=1 Tax=Hordeum vulgare subsp. vulgare TaxID=112509 RepID=A0A8I6XQ70_HORVV|nr:vacuolar protein sorting-associated protein 25-like [Hordeum vulgare subsp. vulgare]XP_044946246.1 vacuolar protein sorting-associated protein 25-like [Hordeum vulgare subsp. vulgare]